MSRLKDILWITRAEGDLWPRGYGLVSRHYADGTARGTIIPFNLLIGWSRYLYWKVRFRWAPPPSWHDIRKAYRAGEKAGFPRTYDAGREAGYDAGHSVGFDDGVQTGEAIGDRAGYRRRAQEEHFASSETVNFLKGYAAGWTDHGGAPRGD